MNVVTHTSPKKYKLWARVSAVILVTFGGVFLYGSVRKTVTHEKFTMEKFIEINQPGQNVMVEFTADWCPNCKYVELTVLRNSKFQDKLIDTETRLLIADWTHYDPEITRLLNTLESKSIPFTAIFPGKDYLRPIVLRDIYTLDTVLDVLDTLE